MTGHMVTWITVAIPGEIYSKDVVMCFGSSLGVPGLGVATDDHNIYYNVATQILTSKLNINNQVTSCSTVNDAIKYADDVLHSVNYQGIGTASQELTDSQMQNIINVHAVLSQFNTNGGAAISPTGLFFTPSMFEILNTNHLDFLVN